MVSLDRSVKGEDILRRYGGRNEDVNIEDREMAVRSAPRFMQAKDVTR